MAVELPIRPLPRRTTQPTVSLVDKLGNTAALHKAFTDHPSSSEHEAQFKADYTLVTGSRYRRAKRR